MRKKLTITIDEEVYEGLRRVVGPRHISGFIETLARPHVVMADLDEMSGGSRSGQAPGARSSRRGRRSSSAMTYPIAI